MWAGFMEKLEHPESDAAGGEMTKVISKMMQLGKKLLEEGASQSQGGLEVMHLMEMFLVVLGGFIFEKGGHVPQYSGSWRPQQLLSSIPHSPRIFSNIAFLNGNFAPSPVLHFSTQAMTLMGALGGQDAEWFAPRFGWY